MRVHTVAVVCCGDFIEAICALTGIRKLVLYSKVPIVVDVLLSDMSLSGVFTDAALVRSVRHYEEGMSFDEYEMVHKVTPSLEMAEYLGELEKQSDLEKANQYLEAGSAIDDYPSTPTTYLVTVCRMMVNDFESLCGKITVTRDESPYVRVCAESARRAAEALRTKMIVRDINGERINIKSGVSYVVVAGLERDLDSMELLSHLNDYAVLVSDDLRIIGTDIRLSVTEFLALVGNKDCLGVIGSNSYCYASWGFKKSVTLGIIRGEELWRVVLNKSCMSWNLNEKPLSDLLSSVSQVVDFMVATH